MLLDIGHPEESCPSVIKLPTQSNNVAVNKSESAITSCLHVGTHHSHSDPQPAQESRKKEERGKKGCKSRCMEGKTKTKEVSDGSGQNRHHARRAYPEGGSED